MNKARVHNRTRANEITLGSLSLFCVLLLMAPLIAQGEQDDDARIKKLEEDVARLKSERQKSEQQKNNLNAFWKEGFRVETEDGAFKFKGGGRLMYDWTWVNEDDALNAMVGDQENGSETRRARLYVSGLIYDNVDFKLQFDFAGGDSDLKDAYIGLQDFPLGKIRAGHFKEPFGLEELTSSKYITFIERSLPIEAFAPSRNAGVMLFDAFCDERATWAAGVFRETDGYGDIKEDGGYSATGRLTALPVFQNEGETLVHVGGAYSYRNNGRDSTLGGDAAQFSASPEAHLLDPFVDTTSFLSHHVELYGVEGAWVNGPLSIQGEYMRARADINSHANLDGYYVQGSYFLTGEQRKYKTSTATFSRVKPKSNFSFKKGQWGAWELALRYSNLDLKDQTVNGGELDNISAGVNWHLNPNARVMFNYIRSERENVGEADIAVIRMQLDF